MIGIPSSPAGLGGIVPAGLGAPPSGAPAGARAPGVDPALGAGFEDVLGQLTGALLALVADVHPAGTPAGSGAPPDDAADDGEADADPSGAVAGFAGVAVPVLVQPQPVIVPAGESLDGAVTPEEGASASGASAPPTGPVQQGGSAAPSQPVPRLPDVPIADPAAFDASVEATADDTIEAPALDAAPTPAPVDGPRVEARPAEGPIGVAARKGGRAEPGRGAGGVVVSDPAAPGAGDRGAGRIEATDAETAAPEPVVPPEAVPAPEAAPASERMAAPALPVPRAGLGMAERAAALQRALARRIEAGGEPQGLVTQAARLVVPPAETGAGGGAADDAGTGRRAGRGWIAPAPGAGLPAASAPAVAAVVAADQVAGNGESGKAPASGPVAGSAWRAAFAAAAAADVHGTAESARPAVKEAVAHVLAQVADRTPAVPGAAPAPAAGAPAEIDRQTGEAVHGQIVRSLRMQWAGSLGEARVTLKPEFLGQVTASITVDRGTVTATLHADTPEVRRWMEANAGSLRDALVEHGLRLDRLEVAEPPREGAEPDRQGRQRGRQQDAPRERPRRRPDDGQDRPFELTP
ncbi:MAG: flagellar hook-length control protein FliK [Vicinamibacterales bacterium]